MNPAYFLKNTVKNKFAFLHYFKVKTQSSNGGKNKYVVGNQFYIKVAFHSIFNSFRSIPHTMFEIY